MSSINGPVVDTGPDPVTGINAFPSLSNAQSNQLVSSNAMVAQLNANLISIYQTGFSNWSISVNAGRIPNTNPPNPPVRYVVSPPDSEGFQWPIIDPSGTPVCAMPPIPANQTTPASSAPNTINVGPSIGGKWFSVGPGDTFPSGMTTPPLPDPSGAMHTYEKFGAPVGPGWYLQVS